MNIDFYLKLSGSFFDKMSVTVDKTIIRYVPLIFLIFSLIIQIKQYIYYADKHF